MRSESVCCVYQEAIERKEKRARRFHFCGEESGRQRSVFLDKDMMKKGERPEDQSPSVSRSQEPVCLAGCLLLWCSAIPRLRLEAIHVSGVDDMSTQDVFGYFKEYPPAHIEWIDDASCECNTRSLTASNTSSCISSCSRVYLMLGWTCDVSVAPRSPSFMFEA